jgi:monovalent cation:H+ antiporter, CPA1 family
MSLFNAFAILTTLAALFAWFNHRFIRLPSTIGLMVIALVSSLGMVVLGRAGVIDVSHFTGFLQAVDFDATLMNGMLGALLFAGALHVDLERLLAQKWIVASLATAGVLISTFVVGVGSWWIFQMVGLDLPLVWTMLFGALISPTDPIAVGAILRNAGVPEALEVKITGESLFNDGIGVVVFVVIAELVRDGGALSAGHVAELFLVEAVGGIVFGVVAGYLLFLMLRSVDNYQVEILLTLALVTGGYALANAMHLSGPLAMVIAGLMIGNQGRKFAMSDTTREHLDTFWSLVDEFLNAGLFVLIGLEIIILEVTPPILWAALSAIPLVLLARWISVVIPVTIASRFRKFTENAVALLTWSGLRGGISVALALSLPLGPERDALVTVTYVVVCFSIIVQGLTVGPLSAKLIARSRSARV